MLTYASCMQSTYASCLEMPEGSRQRGSVLLWLSLISLLVCCFDHLALVVCCCTVLCLVLLSTASSKKRHINHERRLRLMVSARPKAQKSTSPTQVDCTRGSELAGNQVCSRHIDFHVYSDFHGASPRGTDAWRIRCRPHCTTSSQRPLPLHCIGRGHQQQQ